MWMRPFAGPEPPGLEQGGGNPGGRIAGKKTDKRPAAIEIQIRFEPTAPKREFMDKRWFHIMRFRRELMPDAEGVPETLVGGVKA